MVLPKAAPVWISFGGSQMDVSFSNTVQRRRGEHPALALLMCNTVRRSSPLFSHQTPCVWPALIRPQQNWGEGFWAWGWGAVTISPLKSTAEIDRRVHQSVTWGCLRSVVISEAAVCFEFNLKNKKGEMAPDSGEGSTCPPFQTHCQIIHEV